MLAASLALHGAAAPRDAAHPRHTVRSNVAGDTLRRCVVVRGVDLTDLGYDVGDPAAAVVVVEFSDFGCPYCAQFALQTAPALQREFVDSGRVRWKVVPFLAGSFRRRARADRTARHRGCGAAGRASHADLLRGGQAARGRRAARGVRGGLRRLLREGVLRRADDRPDSARPPRIETIH